MGKAKKFIDKIWYGTGAIGLDLSYGMFYSFLNKYLTDVLKLNANFLLILTPIARIWDAINGWDPSGGAIYYYNPRTAKSQWIRTRPVICTIGNHVFCS